MDTYQSPALLHTGWVARDIQNGHSRRIFGSEQGISKMSTRTLNVVSIFRCVNSPEAPGHAKHLVLGPEASKHVLRSQKYGGSCLPEHLLASAYQSHSLRKLPFVSVRFMVGLCDVMTAFLTCLNSTQSDHSVLEKNA